MRPSRQPRHLQLLEKFMIDWEKKVKAGTVLPMNATERKMAESICGWMSEKFTITPVTTYELKKREQEYLQELEVANDQCEDRV